jgi:hypothetical protein
MEAPADKRFYGFLFDQHGFMYILEATSGKYHPRRLDIAPIDLDTDELALMGNLLYWTFTVQNASGKHYYALKTETLEQVRHTFVAAPVNRWDKIAAKLFPYYLTLRKPTSEYIAPQLYFTGWMAWGTNFLLALLFAFLYPRRPVAKRIFGSVYVLIFGIVGAVALLLLPRNDD